MKLAKFVTLGLSAAIFICLLYFLTRFSMTSDAHDVPEMAAESKERLCDPAPSSKSDVLTTTSTKYGTDNTVSTERGTPTGSSAMSSSVKLTPLPTQSHIAPPSTILYLMQTEQCIPPYYKMMDVFGGENQGFEVHVKKLWTSMYNSAYNCDFKNLIAPLNSLGTLEIYQVIKTAN